MKLDMKKVLILSDSLAAPRAVKEGWTKYESTWPKLLRDRFPDILFIQSSIGSATTSDLCYQTRYWQAAEPDLVIFQAGLVDCLPRALHQIEARLLGAILPRKVLEFLIFENAVFLRKIRNISYTNVEKFKSNLEFLKKVFPESYWIEILVGDGASSLRLPRYEARIVKYNSIVHEIFPSQVINNIGFTGDDFVSDGFHLSPSGHQKVADTIAEKIYPLSINCQ